jgi:hypothetical protein
MIYELLYINQQPNQNQHQKTLVLWICCRSSRLIKTLQSKLGNETTRITFWAHFVAVVYATFVTAPHVLLASSI